MYIYIGNVFISYTERLPPSAFLGRLDISKTLRIQRYNNELGVFVQKPKRIQAYTESNISLIILILISRLPLHRFKGKSNKVMGPGYGKAE